MHRYAGRPVVLVADDDATTRYLYAETLTHEGFRVVEASNGEQAVERWQDLKPDLVLLDVEMPVMDGYGACAAILGDKGDISPPVVLVTTHDDQHSIDRAFDLGATDFIAKPISWPLLAHRLRYILRGANNLRCLSMTLDENRALLAALPDHLFILDRDGVVLEHLQGDGSPHCGAQPEPAGLPIETVFPPALRDDVRTELARLLEGGHPEVLEYPVSEQRGGHGFRECRFIAQGPDRVLAIIRDITQRKRADERVHRLAYFDALTGLPNRARFTEQLERALARSSDGLAVLTIDLDRFKRINDTLGMTIGDEALGEVSLRLRRVLDAHPLSMGSREQEMSCLARFAGNAYALLIDNACSRSELSDLADRLGRAIEAPMRLRGHEFVITASIGIAMSPEHGVTAEHLLRNAEAARLDAKKRGSNTQRLYRSSMGGVRLDRLDLETSLRRALDRDELTVNYQPKIDVRSGALVGAEALLRWQHGDRGWISPATFMPIAEEAGMTPLLGEWVAHKVCRQVADWQQQGLPSVPVALNVSAQEFVHGDVHRRLLDCAARYDVAHSLLELEITETMLMSEIDSVVHCLQSLRAHGFGIAVDDFGTGYSSLRYLHRLPINVLKIDQTFVRDVEQSAGSRSICSSIIALGHSLGLTIVGEGVETAWQQGFLEREGCDVLQGFRLGRPLAPERFAAQLEDRQSRIARRHLRVVNDAPPRQQRSSRSWQRDVDTSEGEQPGTEVAADPETR